MNKLITVEASDDLVEIHLNDDGIDFLIERLNSLKKHKHNEHDHLMSPEWGGNEISGIKQNMDNRLKLIHHLKLMYWKGN